MKSNKLMKFLLSLFIALCITSTNTETVSVATIMDYDSQIQLLGEEPEESPLGDLKKQ